jgi:putative oxidoreductase
MAQICHCAVSAHSLPATVCADPKLQGSQPNQERAMNNPLYAFLIAIGRVLMAAIFIHAGMSKIADYAQTAAFMQSHGVPAILLPLVILLELGGGIALALGLFTRFMAAALALFSIAAIVIFVLPPKGQMGMIVLYAEIAMVGGLINYAVQGGGSLSVDGMRQGKRRRAGGFGR